LESKERQAQHIVVCDFNGVIEWQLVEKKRRVCCRWIQGVVDGFWATFNVVVWWWGRYGWDRIDGITACVPQTAAWQPMRRQICARQKGQKKGGGDE
jgi:hypothetical protein